MTDPIIIEFPSLPPSELMPNNLRRIHWKRRADMSKACRFEGYTEAEKVEWPNMQRAILSFRFQVPDKRRRDVCEMIGACKPWIDGALVDSGMLPDDDWSHLSIGSTIVEYVKGNPVTEFIIRSAEDLQGVNHVANE